MNPDLSLVPTDTLIDEIARRADAAIVAFQRADRRATFATFRYVGGFSACLGLVTRFQHRMIRDDQEDADEQAMGEFHE